MIRALLSLLVVLRKAWLFEVCGAGLVVAGVGTSWGVPAGLVAAGVALLLKAFELDTRGVS